MESEPDGEAVGVGAEDAVFDVGGEHMGVADVETVGATFDLQVRPALKDEDPFGVGMVVDGTRFGLWRRGDALDADVTELGYVFEDFAG